MLFLVVAVVGGVLLVGVAALVFLSLRGDSRRLPPPVAFTSRSDPFASSAAPLPPVSPFAASSPFAPGYGTTPTTPEEQSVADGLRGELTPMLQRGDKIGAIKRYRERTGASLLDAKNTIESWAVHGVPQAPAPLPEREPPRVLPIEMRPQLLAQCAELAARDKIGAIKHWRTATGAALVDAKNLVEALVAHGPSGVPGDLLIRAWPSGEPMNGSTSAEPGPPQVLPSPRERFEPAPLTTAERDRLFAECLTIARAGDKIGAIKRWREATGCGLKEAKDVIENGLDGVR